MSHFLEAWISPAERQQFKALRAWDRRYHPHVTLVRPFIPRVDETLIMNQIIEVSSRMGAIKMIAEGAGSFGRIRYIPIISEKLNHFADLLENTIAPNVDFAPRLGERRLLHLTIGRGNLIDPYPRTELDMSRLTAIRNGRIWFAYDLQNHKALTREEVLEK